MATGIPIYAPSSAIAASRWQLSGALGPLPNTTRMPNELLLLKEEYDKRGSWRWRMMPIVVLAGIGLEKGWRGGGATAGENGETLLTRTMSIRHLETICALGLYFISGPALILLNKHMMMNMDFQFPIAISNFGNLGMSLMAHGAVRLNFSQLRSPTIRSTVFFELLLPLSVCSSLSLVLGNYAYLYISVPLIQILKSGTIVLVMLVGFLMRVERFSWQVVIAVGTIALGIGASIGYDSDAAKSEDTGISALVAGVSLMMLANSAEAAKTVFTQVSVDRLTVLDSLYWCSPIVALMGFALSCFFEFEGIAKARPSPALLAAMAGSCLLGGFVNLSTMWATKLVGGLSMKVLVGARNIGLVLFSAIVLDEPCSPMQYAGYSSALLGMALYDRAKQPQAPSTVKQQDTIMVELPLKSEPHTLLETLEPAELQQQCTQGHRKAIAGATVVNSDH